MVQFPEPQAVFRYFSQISAVPHGSGNTAAIRSLCLETAASLGLSCCADAAGNVIIRKQASPGYEQHPGVILQGHLDMVCAKRPDCPIDMEKEPIRLIFDGDTLRADGTTLGGDDGIALAYAFAILADPDAVHPPLTVIFTADEETGMDGAAGLSPDALTGDLLINLDSEDEGVFTVGCAGGVRVHAVFPAQTAPASGTAVTVSLSGLTGGHSGTEIDKSRLNACTAVISILHALGIPFAISALSGGVRDNVIPSECTARLICSQEDAPKICAALQNKADALRCRYPEESGFTFRIETADSENAQAISPARTAALLDVLAGVPNGVQTCNEALHLPQTSLSLGILRLTDAGIETDHLIRSAVNEEKRALADRLAGICRSTGGTVSESGDYPAWEYTPGTQLEQTAVSVYRKMTGKDPVIETIHAGVECGILAAKKPGLQCISVGPDLRDVHTPRESLSIPSAARTFLFLQNLLKSI